MRTIATVAAAASITLLLVAGADAARSRCELAKSTGTGASQAQAKELAMQSLVEAIRDSNMKSQGRIAYRCRTGTQVSCEARQRACRGR